MSKKKYGLYLLYLLCAVVLLFGSYQLATKHMSSVLATVQYITISVAVIFLFAGIYKFRTKIGSTVTNCWGRMSLVQRSLSSLYLTTVVFYLIVIFIGLFWLDNTKIRWWITSFTIVICHFFASFKVVGPRENGVMVLLGRIISSGNEFRHIESGPRFAPWPIQIIRITKNEIVSHFGTAGDEETRRKAEQASDSQSWYVDTEPIRINFGIPTPEEAKEYKNDPLAERLTVDPHMYVTIQIFDPATYVEKVGYSIEEGLERIIATCTRAMQEMAGGTFVAKAVKEIGIMNTRLLAEVERLVGDPKVSEPDVKRGKDVRESWGVDVKEAGIKSLGLPRTINEALRDLASIVPKAERESEAISRKADGERDRLTKEGAGKASARKADNKAEEDKIRRIGNATASALKAQAEVAETPGGRLIISTKAVETGLQHGKVVFLPSGGLSDVVSAVLSGQAAFKMLEEETPKIPPPPAKP